MGLVERLEEDLRQALKNRDEVRVSTLRLARAAVHNAEIERGRPLSDAEVQEVLRREVKRRREAIEAYRRGGREEAARREELEMAVLMEYLPQPLSEEELRALVRQALRETGATTAKDVGRVVGWVMARTQGRADGRRVAELVQEALRD
ncbi:MAG: GatB/YqeY domain-containing protein [Armatimonadota bacterium]|nr:GatB/YqeY domain-containing protein [Armatimonadota bacterium]MDW8157212.1 GatB/YqeY domain-containing protein [Armatimonadota bacterium]